jgi:hypothetical protein
MGVRVPPAEEVAAATCGFACVLHIPNEGMWSRGTQSATVAASAESPLACKEGTMTSFPGLVPSLHFRPAP